MRNSGKVLRALSDPRKAADRLLENVGRYVGRRRYTPFLILTRSRTGSNLLVSMLDSHPSIIARGELLGRLAGRSLDDLLTDAYCRTLPHIKAVGFKLFYYHPIDGDPVTVWRRLGGIDDLRIIHLKRRNVLRTLLSRKIAGSTNIWRRQSGANTLDASVRRVEMSYEELSEGFEETQRWELAAQSWFGAGITLEVAYEDLTSSPEAQFRRITQALGVPIAEPRIALQRQNPEPLDELLANYRSLKHAFAGTSWATFFDE